MHDNETQPEIESAYTAMVFYPLRCANWDCDNYVKFGEVLCEDCECEPEA